MNADYTDILYLITFGQEIPASNGQPMISGWKARLRQQIAATTVESIFVVFTNPFTNLVMPAGYIPKTKERTPKSHGLISQARSNCVSSLNDDLNEYRIAAE